jgi:cytochrome c
MDNLTPTKILAAFLVAGITFHGAGLLASALVHPEHPEHVAIKVAGVAEPTASAETPVTEDPPVETLLGSADPSRGEADVKRLCSACHTFTNGGHAGVGPNLYGIVGLPHGHMAGFPYSSALAGKPGDWTIDDLYKWLKSPRTFVPGTKMSFAGIDNPKTRADVIAFLNSNSEHPAPLPVAAKAPPTPAKANPAVPPTKKPTPKTPAPLPVTRAH